MTATEGGEYTEADFTPFITTESSLEKLKGGAGLDGLGMQNYIGADYNSSMRTEAHGEEIRGIIDGLDESTRADFNSSKTINPTEKYLTETAWQAPQEQTRLRP